MKKQYEKSKLRTEHHSCGVEAAAVEVSPDPGVLAQHGLVVGREGLGAADRRLDARGLEHGHAVHGALDVHAEHLPVQLVQAEGELTQSLPVCDKED